MPFFIFLVLLFDVKKSMGILQEKRGYFAHIVDNDGIDRIDVFDFHKKQIVLAYIGNCNRIPEQGGSEQRECRSKK